MVTPTPTVALIGEASDMLNTGARFGWMVKGNSVLTEAPLGSVPVTVTWVTPGVVGVPTMAVVLGLNVSTGGRLMTDTVIGSPFGSENVPAGIGKFTPTPTVPDWGPIGLATIGATLADGCGTTFSVKLPIAL